MFCIVLAGRFWIPVPQMARNKPDLFMVDLNKQLDPVSGMTRAFSESFIWENGEGLDCEKPTDRVRCCTERRCYEQEIP